MAGDFRKPIIFENVAQGQEYVERELALLGREFVRESELRWIIAADRGDIRHQNYLLWLNPDLQSFLIHHSNVETGLTASGGSGEMWPSLRYRVCPILPCPKL